MWRISGDFWDNWAKLKHQFDLTHVWESDVHPGGWPDADMLPLDASACARKWESPA